VLVCLLLHNEGRGRDGDEITGCAIVGRIGWS
jgi:hypothetical protein